MHRDLGDFNFGSLLRPSNNRTELKVPTSIKAGAVVAFLVWLALAAGVIVLLVLAIQWLSGKV